MLEYQLGQGRKGGGGEFFISSFFPIRASLAAQISDRHLRFRLVPLFQVARRPFPFLRPLLEKRCPPFLYKRKNNKPPSAPDFPDPYRFSSRLKGRRANRRGLLTPGLFWSTAVSTPISERPPLGFQPLLNSSSSSRVPLILLPFLARDLIFYIPPLPVPSVFPQPPERPFAPEIGWTS